MTTFNELPVLSAGPVSGRNCVRFDHIFYQINII